MASDGRCAQWSVGQGLLVLVRECTGLNWAMEWEITPSPSLSHSPSLSLTPSPNPILSPKHTPSLSPDASHHPPPSPSPSPSPSPNLSSNSRLGHCRFTLGDTRRGLTADRDYWVVVRQCDGSAGQRWAQGTATAGTLQSQAQGKCLVATPIIVPTECCSVLGHSGPC